MNQAELIIAKFGGITPLYWYLKSTDRPRTKSAILRWTFPRERGGTGGLIPQNMHLSILKAARVAGIILKPEELQPAYDIPKGPYKMDAQVYEAFQKALVRKKHKSRERDEAVNAILKRTKLSNLRDIKRQASDYLHNQKKAILRTHAEIEALEAVLINSKAVIDYKKLRRVGSNMDIDIYRGKPQRTRIRIAEKKADLPRLEWKMEVARDKMVETQKYITAEMRILKQRQNELKAQKAAEAQETAKGETPK